MQKFTFSRKHLPAGFLMLLATCGGSSPDVVPGVSLELAQQRAATISNINYRLWFGIPPDHEQSIDGRVTVEFDLNDTTQPLQLDFRESADKILTVFANDAASQYKILNEHIVIPVAELAVGANTIEIEFVGGDTSLNRNPDYLYTLFVPDRARTAFPLFDQPDIKATYELSLALPVHWTAISYAGIDRVEITKDSQHPITLRFAKSEPVSSYLFSFVAGKFEIADATAEMKERQSTYAMKMLHRETDVEKVERNLPEIMRLHQSALEWLTEYTGIEYPFSKLDFALIPSFQYGGMEHVGAIQYRADSLLLDENPSDTELLGRASLIAHEVSHMWFGNLVTMKWFNDVWTKEVFANFMAAKIVNPNFPDIDHDLNFMMRHHPRAYAVDRSEGANPIRQELLNLNEAGQMYGAIIYNKAPIMMRQLELIVGEEKFREGMQEYLQRFSYANATWPELVAILDEKSDADLAAWSEVWVNTPGRPEFELRTRVAPDGSEEDVLLQIDRSGQNRVWPQQLRMFSYRQDSTGTWSMSNQRVVSEAAATVLPAQRERPAEREFGAGGIGYGSFPADLALLSHWDRMDERNNGAFLINVYENVLTGNIRYVESYLLTLLDIVSREDNQLLIDLALQQIATAHNNLLTTDRRQHYAAELERVLWDAMLRQPDSARTKVFFMAFARLASNPDAVEKVIGVWSRELAVEKLTLSENDDIELAQILAIRLPDQADKIVQQQLERTENPDSRRKLEFVAPSLSPSVKVRDEFFASLELEQNRQTESWVLDALENLHHPSRLSDSEKYLLPSLELLQEIQATGDIFFPTRWLVTSLRNHRSDTAVATVRTFLAERPDYNAQLRMKILQAADMLFRSNAITAAVDTNN